MTSVLATALGVTPERVALECLEQDQGRPTATAQCQALFASHQWRDGTRELPGWQTMSVTQLAGLLDEPISRVMDDLRAMGLCTTFSVDDEPLRRTAGIECERPAEDRRLRGLEGGGATPAWWIRGRATPASRQLPRGVIFSPAACQIHSTVQSGALGCFAWARLVGSRSRNRGAHGHDYCQA